MNVNITADDIASPQLDNKLKELQGAVNEYSRYDTSRNKNSSISSLPSLSALWDYVYIIIPVVLLIVLIVTRPSFVKVEVKMDDGTIKNQTSFQKIIVWTLVIGGLLDIGLYGANYKFRPKP